MTTRDNKTRNNLFDLACRIDERLRAGGHSENILDINNDRETQHGSISGLSDRERQEFKAAKSALYFLNRVRVDLDVQSNQQDSSILLPGTRHSTVNGLETLHDDSVEEFEFTNLGRFEIIRPVGQGGFAKVYLARDPHLDREVAIKVLQTHALMADESRVRFEREARAAAVLSHPAILPIYETGIVGPITFIVSEYCPGSTLAAWFSDLNQKTDSRTAAEIAAQLAEAAQHAHQRGVIHRDLKPSNVLIQDGDAAIAQRLRVTDFGMAKQLESDDMTITTEGAVVGTPAYMSPEQARGSTEIDGATDIFSLGVILYELLTGKLPFKKSGHLSTLNAIANDIPVAPRKINDQVPKDLEAICLKCLNKRPEDRYANAYALADDLQAWLSDRQVTARHATKTERLVRWVHREPALAAAVSFAFFSLLFGLSLTAWQWQAAQVNLVESNVQRDRALKNINRIQATVESVLDEYGNSQDEQLYLDPGQYRIINEMISIHEQLINEEAHALNVTESTIASYVKIARLHRKLVQPKQSLEICQQARTLAELAIKNNPQQETELRNALVEINVQEICLAIIAGQHERAEKIALDGISVMDKFVPQTLTSTDNFRRFVLNRHLGLALHGQDKYESAVPYMEKGKQYAADLVAAEPSNEDYQACYGNSLQDVATAYRSVGRNEESNILLEDALARFQELESRDSRAGDYRYRIGYLQLDLGASYWIQGRMDEAALQLAASRRTLEELVAERPNDVEAYSRLVQTIFRLASFAEALDDYEEAKSMHELGLQMAEDVKKDFMKRRYQLFFRVQHAALLINHFAQENDEWVGDIDIEKLLDQAIEIGEAAIVDYPNEISHVEHLLEAYRHKGRMLHYREQHEEAHQLFDRAAVVSIEKLRANPDHDKLQNLAISRAAYAAKRAAEFSRFEAARSFLVELADAAPIEMLIQLESARYFSRLVGDLQRTGHSSDKISEIESIALHKLATAFELGFVSQGEFEQQDEWKPIRDSDAFKKLVESK